jgi:hypothetical protein
MSNMEEVAGSLNTGLAALPFAELAEAKQILENVYDTVGHASVGGVALWEQVCHLIRRATPNTLPI